MEDNFPNLRKGRRQKSYAAGAREGMEKGASVALTKGITTTQKSGAIA